MRAVRNLRDPRETVDAIVVGLGQIGVVSDLSDRAFISSTAVGEKALRFRGYPGVGQETLAEVSQFNPVGLRGRRFWRGGWLGGPAQEILPRPNQKLGEQVSYALK